MREADRFTCEDLGVPSMLLMERAGEALASEAKKMLAEYFEEYGERGEAKRSGVLCVCGGGNNGGDGFVCARLLLSSGESVAAVCLSERFSADCRKNKESFESAGGTVYAKIPEKKYAVIVDCLFGTGFKGRLSGENGDLADYINAERAGGAKVLAADMPSGVSGDNGEADPRAVQADVTLCLGEYKTGAFLSDGADFSGAVKRADIGIALPNLLKNVPYARLLGGEEVAKRLPKRRKNTHKGSFGKVAIVAGSEQYTGAAYLAGAAALRCGAGYTALFLPKKVKRYYYLKLPEALIYSISDGNKIEFNEEKFKKLLDYDSIAFGMGAGNAWGMVEAIRFLFQNYTGKLLLDADALNAVAKLTEEEKEELFANKKCAVLLTPHLKEFERLTGKGIERIKKDRIRLAEEFSKKHAATLLLKGNSTVITDGENTYLNITGTPAMAKGGSGDVLSGGIASISATGCNLFDSALIGAYIAGKAAEIASRRTGEYSLTATDEIEALGAAFLSLNDL